jgi:hypothetical protein
LGFFALTVPSFAGSSVSCSVRQEEVYLRPRALTSLFLIGPVTTFATQEGIPAVARAAQLAEAAAEGAQRRAADREAVRIFRESLGAKCAEGLFLRTPVNRGA